MLIVDRKERKTAASGAWRVASPHFSPASKVVSSAGAKDSQPSAPALGSRRAFPRAPKGRKNYSLSGRIFFRPFRAPSPRFWPAQGLRPGLAAFRAFGAMPGEKSGLEQSCKKTMPGVRLRHNPALQLRFDEDFVVRGEVAGGRSDDCFRADENFLTAADGVADVGLAHEINRRGQGLGARG